MFLRLSRRLNDPVTGVELEPDLILVNALQVGQVEVAGNHDGCNIVLVNHNYIAVHEDIDDVAAMLETIQLDEDEEVLED